MPDSLVYEEDPASASKRDDRREKYKLLVKDYQAGRFNALICWDLDRLTRQPRQLEDWIEAAEERGLRLITANGEADLGTDGGRLYARIKAAVSRGEMERKSERQKAANKQRAAAGGHYGRVMPYGYVRDKTVGLTKDPEVSDALGEGFSMALAGQSIRSISDYWTAKGLKPRRVEKWNTASVHRILTAPVYAGVLVRDGEVLDVATAWEPYISKENHQQLKALLASRLKGGGRTKGSRQGKYLWPDPLL